MKWIELRHNFVPGKLKDEASQRNLVTADEGYPGRANCQQGPDLTGGHPVDANERDQKYDQRTREHSNVTRDLGTKPLGQDPNAPESKQGFPQSSAKSTALASALSQNV